MANRMEALRQIPPMNDILRCAELAPFQTLLQTPFGRRIVEEALADTRRALLASSRVVSRDDLTAQISADIAGRARRALQPSLRRVINATGVVLHTNLGRSPLPKTALQHVIDVATGYSNLEFVLAEGVRGKRDVHVKRLLCELLGCEAAIVVNNNAAAVLLILNTLGEAGEIIASRGEQVEIGGSFRIPEIVARSGARLREVGTTNRTRISDYRRAINENTRLLLRVHPSNFRLIGFCERPSLEEFVEAGRERGIPTVEDLGSGCLFDMNSAGITGEPVVSDSVKAGVDVVCFSCDKLMGGPQSGVIAGKRVYVDRIRQNPLYRAVRVDKLTLATLESVLLSHLSGRLDDIPVLRMLHATEDALRRRAESLAERIGGAARPLPLRSVVGGGSAPENHLPSWGVALTVAGLSDAALEQRLRISEPPIIVRIENSCVVLDVRTIDSDDEATIVTAIHEAGRV
jgi:L-seryl-tRNA(Ser) seleniumtransferase